MPRVAHDRERTQQFAHTNGATTHTGQACPVGRAGVGRGKGRKAAGAATAERRSLSRRTFSPQSKHFLFFFCFNVRTVVTRFASAIVTPARLQTHVRRRSPCLARRSRTKTDSGRFLARQVTPICKIPKYSTTTPQGCAARQPGLDSSMLWLQKKFAAEESVECTVGDVTVRLALPRGPLRLCRLFFL